MTHITHANQKGDRTSQEREESSSSVDQQVSIDDGREMGNKIASLQRKINASHQVTSVSGLQTKVDHNLSPIPEHSGTVQRTINIDQESNDRDRVNGEVESLIAANPKIKEMDDGNPVVRVKMVRHDEPQGHRGFTRYEGDGLYIELEEPAVDGINLRETLHHELLNHGYKMYKHLETRADMTGIGKIWDRLFPAYAPSELLDHLAYISETVDKAYGMNIIDQWYQDVDTTVEIMDQRMDWMLGYLDRFLEHVLESKYSIFGRLNESEEGRAVMEEWGIDVDSDNPHDEIEAVLRKETELRKADVRSTVPKLIV